MRVVAGSARSVMLMTPAGMDTRPTTDRIKETLFNMIQSYVPGAAVLDLFAGSGGLGIEALSRGADSACFSDYGRDAVKCIEANLKKTRLDGKAEVLQMDYKNALAAWKNRKKKFDLVFIDPPYGKNLEFEALRMLKEYELVDDDTLIVVEAPLDHEGYEFKMIGFDIIKIKVYKSNMHYFLKKKQ